MLSEKFKERELCLKLKIEKSQLKQSTSADEVVHHNHVTNFNDVAFTRFTDNLNKIAKCKMSVILLCQDPVLGETLNPILQFKLWFKKKGLLSVID